MTRDELDRINELIANEAPIPTLKWRVQWRFYMGSQHNTVLVGFWMAARELLPKGAPRTGIVSLAGGDIRPYTYGDEISGWDKVTTSMESTPVELVREGVKALERLQEFLANNPV